MTAAAAAKPKRTEERTSRPSSERRRKELVEHAARILNERGIEELHVTALAQSAGVSRPLVYRVFPTREALFRAVLEDFAADVGVRFHAALVRALPGTLESLTRAFIEASCDAIEAKGAGPWALIDPRGVTPELARISTEIFSRMLDPWRDKLAEFTGDSKRRAANHLGIIVAAGRAALAGWLDGAISRAEAVADATNAVAGLMNAFAAAAAAPERKAEPAPAKPAPAKPKPKQKPTKPPPRARSRRAAR
ncbi:MAG: TetR/AcrR family transcriptional regulator [Polyangiaceae bacterium]|nr:TetR/AcrR family transcriptional regulator [Polyangiaceae bacterium]